MSSSSASGPASGLPSGPFSGPASRSRRLASRQTAKVRSHSGTHPTGTRRSKRGAIATTSSSTVSPVTVSPVTVSPMTVSPMAVASKTARKSAAKKSAAKKPLRAPRPVRQLVRWLVRGPQKAPRKVLMAGGSVATLAALVIVPTRVDSQQVALSSCQEVVQSGAEISRAQVTSLLAVPEGSRREAVRQVIDVPYCLLPAQKEEVSASEKNSEKNSETAREAKSETAAEIATILTEREAYPLAFDPEAWVVVRYAEGEYAGYDFVFKP